MRKFAVFLLVFLVIAGFYPKYTRSSETKIKGICIHGEEIEKQGAPDIMGKLKEEGFNTVFLLVKNPQGYVYFKSSDFPVKYPILSDTILAAKKYGMDVYVYFPVFMDQHYGTLHPEQCMTDISGKKNSYYVSLLSDEYLAYLKKFVRELLRYDIKGIVFDYIRFPNGKYDFSEAFKNLALSDGIDFEYVKEKAYETFVYPADWKTLFVLADSDPEVRKWINLREQIVENEAQILTEYIRNIDPNIKIGVFSVARGCASKITDTDNIKETYEYQVANFGQAPDKSFPFVDFVSPMVYLNSLKEKPEYTISVVKKFKSANKKRDVLTAINPYGIPAKDANLQILYALSFGEGMILFRYPLFTAGKITFEQIPKPDLSFKAKIYTSKEVTEKTFSAKNEPFYPVCNNIIFTNGFLKYAKVNIFIGKKTGRKTMLPFYKDEPFEMDTAPFIKDNRTFVPIRFVSENLGANVFWDGEKREVTIETKNHIIKMQIGKKTFFSNEKLFEMDTAPFIKDNRTFVPIRFVSENLGANVFWDGEKREVTIERFVMID